jgi:dienelactone hydrolase
MRYFLCLILLLVFTGDGIAASSPTPPKQPKSGPGGSDYVYTDIEANRYGQGNLEYWIFEPRRAEKPLPVIVFNHGWNAVNPAVYGGWITHLVRQGNIVIYPRWQTDSNTSPKSVSENAINAVKNALVEISYNSHAKADLGKFAIVGHSMGGIISANMAAAAKEKGLPRPGALMITAPGKTWSNPKGNRERISLLNIHKIPAETLMLVVVGEDDTLAKDRDAKAIFKKATSIAPGNKDYVIVHSDKHGKPPLKAAHSAPSSFGAPWNNMKAHANALDYFAYWKLFDGLRDAAFYSKNRESALGNTDAQRFMGTWSDGQPVTPLTIITTLQCPF